MTLPIYLADCKDPDQIIVRAELESAGWRFQTQSDKTNSSPDPNVTPVAIINGRTADPSLWLNYADNGGVVLWIDPDQDSAGLLGLHQFNGRCEEARMTFHPDSADLPVTTLVFGSISLYGQFTGKTLGMIAETESNRSKRPGIIEISYGRGKILAVLFSLSGHISHMHQRTTEIAGRTPEASAEMICLQDTDTASFLRPQLDLFVDWFSGLINQHLVAAGRPMPCFARLPRGYKSLMAFSFDDISPAWKPLRKALSRLRSSIKNRSRETTAAILSTIRAFFKYPANYREQVRWMLDLFSRYNVTASVYVLPFFANISNRPQITGYKGFSTDTYRLLRNSGWDVGTHIKPSSIKDYAALQHRFTSRFKTAPAGHRGHELGWAGWDEDWIELERLGYEYDTTWNWGGHDGLAWILGTSFPFHPVDRNRRMMSILEVPVVGWLEDLVRNPTESISEVEAALDRYPGIYHFGGHSRLMNDPPYTALVVELLEIASRRRDVGAGWNIAQLVSYWKNRERSGISEPQWDDVSAVFSCQVQSACADGELTVAMPLFCQDRRIYAVYANDRMLEFKLRRHAGTNQVIFNLGNGLQRINVLYR